MSDVAISVENLGKAYRIGLKEEIPDSIVGAAIGWIKAPLRNLHRLRRLNTFNVATDTDAESADDTIWALKDVSFEVKRGEVVGIIGRNGAGKSTLLKVLSRITEPTTGRAVIHGRVSSLLEVGTGFHPEMSGRENVYMNGTILGMTKREIDRKFDEIIDFSGVEKFLDTPVKRYSSGMKVRLAFAVAAHLEPEILIIDEVLAVGDAEFQTKCLGKMQDVAEGGRTVLFVSHNMAAVERLCKIGIVLQNGTVASISKSEDAVREYFSNIRGDSSAKRDAAIRSSDGPVRITSVKMHVNNRLVRSVPSGTPIVFVIAYEAESTPFYCDFRIKIRNSTELLIAKILTDIQRPRISPLSGDGHLVCHVDSVNLQPGVYEIDIALCHGPNRIQNIESICRLEVTPPQGFNTNSTAGEGIAYLPAHWSETIGQRVQQQKSSRWEAEG